MHTLKRQRIIPAATALLMLVLSGCSSLSPEGPTAADSPGERWHVALQMLARGEERRAEKAFVELQDTPGYRERARHMLDQIRRPVHRYFPDDHFNVRLRAGQTLSELSRHYLDDPLKFFALARYNGIAAPNRVGAGQLIRIPLTEHARRIRTAETGSPEADDPIDESFGAETTTGSESGVGGGEGLEADTELSDAERERVRRYYREATVAFQQQDLDRTLRYCKRVLKLDSDHENCLSYRDRARTLQRRLDRIQQEEDGAGG